MFGSALGLPDLSITKSLEENIWTYWYDTVRKGTIQFDENGYVEKELDDPRTTFVPEYSEILPPPGKALVYFLRPAIKGFTLRAAILNGDKPIANIPSRQKVAYLADAGEHLFTVLSANDMVITDNVDFMKASLEAGKIYFVSVFSKGNGFEFKPHIKREFSHIQFVRRFKRCVMRNEKGSSEHARTWYTANQDEIRKAKEDAYTKWQQKPVYEKAALKTEDGL